MNHEAHEDRQAIDGRTEEAARQVVDAGLKVHRTLGPGLLESAYEHCLAHELQLRGFAVRRQVMLPIEYQGTTLDAGYRLDLLVEESVVVEVKSVDSLAPLHWAQVLT